jgi:hypothetical protein
MIAHGLSKADHFNNRDMGSSKLKVGILALLIFVCDYAYVCKGLSAEDKKPLLDVNDTSILWPVPQTVQQANLLIDGSETLLENSGTLWPKKSFDQVLVIAKSVKLKTAPAARERQIKFQAEFEKLSTWKVAGIRIDPSAPGCSDQIIGKFGSRPQIRLIMQPVTVAGQNARPHDFTAHLVFEYVKGIDPTTSKALPDRVKFQEIVNDLQQLKIDFSALNIKTQGDLSIHPALVADQKTATDKFRNFLRKHLRSENLSAVAFMGIDPPDPWIFFATAKNAAGDFERKGHPTLGTELAEMLSNRDSPKVFPEPRNNQFGAGVGISTGQLFRQSLVLEDAALSATNPTGVSVKLKDIPDIVANPQMSHFFNTDCVSCHTESTRRANLNLLSFNSNFRYQRPNGISSITATLRPNDVWNVRNFGWGHPRNGGVVATASQRTANEAAETTDFINRNYLTSQPNPNVANPLTLVMKIKSAEDKKQLQTLISKLQSMPPEQNPITIALKRIGNVHFARFVFIDDNKLAVITSYDDDFETYILTFVEDLGDIFDQLLTHIDGAPPLPVKKNPQEFLEFVKKHDLTCEQPFFSAYPTLKVQDILRLQQDAANTSNGK